MNKDTKERELGRIKFGFKGKRKDNGEWIEGWLFNPQKTKTSYIIRETDEGMKYTGEPSWFEVYQESIECLLQEVGYTKHAFDVEELKDWIERNKNPIVSGSSNDRITIYYVDLLDKIKELEGGE